MQRDLERDAELSTSPDEDALVLRQKPAQLQVRDKDDVTLQQWKVRQLQRLAEELKAEWQEARFQRVRELERLYLSNLLDEASGRSIGSDLDSEGPIQRGSAKLPRAKERHRTVLREERGYRDERPRHLPKTRKKATGSGRRGSAKTRGMNPNEKGRGKRVPSSKRSSSHQPMGPRGSRGLDMAKLNPLLAGVGETEYVDDMQKELSREGRRQMGRGTSRFVQNVNHSSRDQSQQGKPTDLEQMQPLSSTSKQETTSQGSPGKYSDKNQWHKEMESTFEELVNTNRKLKKHLGLHIEQSLKVDPKPDEQQSFSETQGDSDTQREESTEEAETTPAEESGSPTEVETEVPETWSKTNMKQLLSENDYPRYQHMARYSLKNECLTPVPEVGTSTEQDDSHSESLESGSEPPRLATLVEDSPVPQPQKQVDSLASWMALRLKQRAEIEPRRQKTLFELTEHPDMSLEIHYKAELEEERRERRRMRLAILKSYPTGFQVPVPSRSPELGSTTLLDSSLLDEDKQSQMIRDLQQQILEQNKLHKQFLEKARKRLQEFQKTF